jgi:2-phosphoglycolate phosphatase
MSTDLQAIFFDLDGTLFDTAPDIADALNVLLKKYNRSPAPFETIRPVIPKGTMAILEQAFSIDRNNPHFKTLTQELLSIYQDNLTHKTKFFPDMEIVLNYLDKNKIKWGIVTSKLVALTQPLLIHFKLNQRGACLITGDSLPHQKPHPYSLFEACKRVGSKPEFSVYVGDTEDDMRAARSAGMKAVAVSYGYYSKESPPEKWAYDKLIHTPIELIEWVNSL